MNDITGILLAGGRAQRLGGQDKGLLQLGGRALVDICAAKLAAQTAAVVVVANRNRELYAEFGYEVVADDIAGFAGPLAGMHAGMAAAATEWVLSAPCDSPFLPDDLAARLMQAAVASGAEVAVATAAGRAQPVFMLARRDLRDDIAAFLQGGDGKIMHWVKQRKFAEAAFEDASAFDNINTAEELSAAEEKCAARSG